MLKSPTSYFTFQLILFVSGTGYAIYDISRSGISFFPVMILLMMPLAAVFAAQNLKRYRLETGGFTIQNIITRRSRQILYQDMKAIKRGLVPAGSRNRAEYSIQVHHGGGIEEILFFDEEERNRLQQQLERVRAGEPVEPGTVELPAARVVQTEDGSWLYPWKKRRSG
jgi:hypothetical protein